MIHETVDINRLNGWIVFLNQCFFPALTYYAKNVDLWKKPQALVGKATEFFICCREKPATVAISFRRYG